MTSLILDPIEDVHIGKCPCCANPTTLIEGWVHDGSVALANYMAHWSNGHPTSGLDLALCFGDFSGGAEFTVRETFVVRTWRRDEHVHTSFVDGPTSRFAGLESYGRLVPIDEARMRVGAVRLWDFVDAVTKGDERIRRFLTAN